MGIGTGVQASFGYKAESVYGTAVTVDKWNDFNSESLALEQKMTEPQGLAAGRLVPLVARWQQTTRAVSGGVEMDFAVKDMSRLLKLALGSNPTPTLISGAAYRHNHQLGSTQGMSHTWQFGKDQRDGTTRPFTYSGVKCTGWEFGSSEGELVTLKLDAMARDVATGTALATPSYAAGNEIFNHQQLVVKLGGTPSTSSGLVSISGGTPLATTVKGASVKGANPYSESYGTSATLLEPLQNGLQDITVDIDGEFTSRTEIYDVWRANTTVALELIWTGSSISGGAYTLDVVIPAAKIWTDALNVDGPDIVPEKFTFKVGSDATNNPLSVILTTTDSAL
jgi:hypothetical protein